MKLNISVYGRVLEVCGVTCNVFPDNIIKYGQY